MMADARGGGVFATHNYSIAAHTHASSPNDRLLCAALVRRDQFAAKFRPRGLCGRYDWTIRLPVDCDMTAIRPRYNRSTTYDGH